MFPSTEKFLATIASMASINVCWLMRFPKAFQERHPSPRYVKLTMIRKQKNTHRRCASLAIPSGWKLACTTGIKNRQHKKGNNHQLALEGPTSARVQHVICMTRSQPLSQAPSCSPSCFAVFNVVLCAKLYIAQGWNKPYPGFHSLSVILKSVGYWMATKSSNRQIESPSYPTCLKNPEYQHGDKQMHCTPQPPVMINITMHRPCATLKFVLDKHS